MREIRTLANDLVRLERLSLSHLEGLEQATQDGNLWELWFTIVPMPEDMKKDIERRLKLYQQGSMLPYTVICQKSGKILGMTSYMNIDHEQNRLEIGSTWYAKSVQGTAVNVACKLLLLEHAFEVFKCVAVEFRTHHLNFASQRAIESIGAKLDGILRNHRKMNNGTLRDTCVYSIINSEWKTIKAHLSYKLMTKQQKQ
ncbi:GNAT family N-acetyltransferase [Cysteiniphilum halobium]|uniref:GNAT family N-acetyltransferase n=1 Tax=Cysteiniphilum halobium TaxID=2219059 RepID=UPI000E659DA9|nr:GNAT family protein [Cysteiniphilum halobium]